MRGDRAGTFLSCYHAGSRSKLNLSMDRIYSLGSRGMASRKRKTSGRVKRNGSTGPTSPRPEKSEWWGRRSGRCRHGVDASGVVSHDSGEDVLRCCMEKRILDSMDPLCCIDYLNETIISDVHVRSIAVTRPVSKRAWACMLHAERLLDLAGLEEASGRSLDQTRHTSGRATRCCLQQLQSNPPLAITQTRYSFYWRPWSQIDPV